ncbi:P-type conjugative transfer protein VirB9 [Bartonella machadoae]|uniref:P-type conjugative transfer protein VirB9 n=1 Tax=Bartonella machadoae TaxID=2893471 RepID=UPI001F4C9F73|nr:P-type conjugative transfer protein VirB9 [Bartonella machadoae]UNE53885.1 P-type conjugative transfer protein VirB9 [Bartonella machadoae]
MKKKFLFLFLTTIAFSPAYLGNASVFPTRAPNDSRIRFINYDAYNVTKIIGSIRSSVQIEFSPSEEIAHVAIGNSVAWEVAPAGNILFLKAREVQPITNLQVVTTRRDGSKRSYQFELMVKDEEITSGNETYFLVKFRYPQDEAEQRRIQALLRQEKRQAQRIDSLFDASEQYGPRNWAYTAQGSITLEPSSVYDNGKTTTFTFPDNQEIPAIYIVSSDGTESLVPKTTKGNMVIVHAISSRFTLRHGRNVLCIFNEAYQRQGTNPGTGTTSPSVERKVASDL